MSSRPCWSGLRDAHVHLAMHGEALSCVDLSACASVAECLERIAAVSQGKRPEEWVLAIKARPEGWSEPRWPTADELDAAAGARPCVVKSFDHHALAAGRRALEESGVAGATRDPEGGVILRDPRGRPTGLLLEKACEPVWRAMPAPSAAQRKEHLRAAIRDLLNRGYVEAHDMLTPAWMGPLLAELADEGDEAVRSFRVRLYAPLEDAEVILRGSERWARETVRLAGAKLFLDGTLNSRTAWMLEPYLQPLPGLDHGKPMHSPDDLRRAVKRCDELGLPAAMHAIGDRAVRAGLDAIEDVEPETLGWRIEHCQFVDEADIPRFADLGVIASVQPCHLLTDIEALERVVGERTRERAFPLRDLIDAAKGAGYEAGDLVWMGSDTPVVDPSPEDNRQASVERRRAAPGPSAPMAPRQAITEDEWLACQRCAAE